MREKQSSQHNVNYWRFGDYLGIGAGAHSKVSYGGSNEVKRYVKFKSPKIYQNSINGYRQETKLLNESDLIFEYMLNVVRLKQKISLKSFTQSTGIDASILIEKLDVAIGMNWLEHDDHSLQLTKKGYLVSDEIVKLLL